MKKTLIAIAMLIVFSGCSGKQVDATANYETAAVMPEAPQAQVARDSSYEMMAEAQAVKDAAGGVNTTSVSPPIINGNSAVPKPDQQKKIIKTANINLESEKFDESVEQIKEIARSTNGYFESSNINTETRNNATFKYYNATLRIPADKYDTVKQQIEDMNILLSSNEYTEDSTSTYYDIEARLKTKEAEEKRLLELINKAAKIEDIITIETRLGEVRTDIEIYKSNLINIDSLSSYSTINISLRQKDLSMVTIKSTDDFATRIKAGFSNSVNGTIHFLQEVVVFFSYITIPLVVIIIIVAVVYSTIKRIRKKEKEI